MAFTLSQLTTRSSSFQKLARFSGVLGLSVALFTLSGCGGSEGPEMVTTQGAVTWQGQPLETGRVVFRLLEGDQRGFSAPIQDGQFRIETYPGKVRVEIRASRIVPGKFDNSNPDEPAPMGEMYIPSQYNSQSTLVLNLPVDDNAEFNLEG